MVHLPDGLEIIWPRHFGAQIETGEYGQHVGDLGTHVGILQLTHQIVSGTCIQISYGDVRIRVGCSMPDLPGMVSACCNLCKFVSVKGCGAGWTADAGCVCRKDTSTDLRFLQTQFTIFVLPPYSWFIVLKKVVQPPRSQRLAPCNLEKHPEAFRRSLGQIATLRAHGSLFAEDSINAVWDAKTNRKPNLQ